ncbi:MAG: biopolymer transporter ExbD [Vampirovibrio sp.]|nr:biopolymer transporter ExbD [Vampirovibrio sp.]
MAASQSKIFSEINITPLTDIFLVLLIIMMIVAPMMSQMNQDIKPPTVENGEGVEQGKLTVEVTKDGQFFVEGNEVAATGLLDIMKTHIAENAENAGSTSEPVELNEKGLPSDIDDPAKTIVIRADKTARSGAVMKIFEAARDAGFYKVTVAGEALSKSRQDELQLPSSSAADTFEDTGAFDTEGGF